MRYITRRELLVLFKKHINHDRSAVLDLEIELKKAGYAPELTDIDFSLFQLPIQHYIDERVLFHKLKISRCKLVEAEYNNCMLTNVEYKAKSSNFYFHNCVIYAHGNAEKKAFLQVNDNSNKGNLLIDMFNRMPIVGIVYTPSHGTSMTRLLIKVLKKRGLNIVRLYSKSIYDFMELGSNIPHHLLFKHPYLLDGIVLPGGKNVLTEQNKYTHREKLETYLLELSLKYKIPTLGVCRGHQFIGHYFGAKIKNLNVHKEDIIHVLPNPDSKLYELTKRKFESQKRKEKSEDIEKNGHVYIYTSVCMHSQGVFFQKKRSKKVKVTALAEDGLIEGLQVKKHIISFQHHHEDCQDDRLGKAALKMFSRMVNTYHYQKYYVPSERREIKRPRLELVSDLIPEERKNIFIL